jgi:cytochrome c556
VHVFDSTLRKIAAASFAATAALSGAHEDREATMKAQGAQAGILFGMAQEKVPYDAAAASAAAAALLEVSSWDPKVLFPEGSVEGRALPAIWENFDDFNAKHEALVAAATTMTEEAGKGLDQLKAAIGPIGAACGACHERYRKPE